MDPVPGRLGRELKTFPPVFRDPGREAEFLAHSLPASLSLIRLALGIGLAVYTAFGLVDLRVFEGHLSTVLTLRYGLGCPTIAFVLGLTYTQAFPRWEQTALISCVAVVAATVYAMIALEPAGHAYLTGEILIMFFAYLFLRIRYLAATAFSLWLVAAYPVVAQFLNPVAPATFLPNMAFLLGGFWVASLLAYYFEVTTRRQYLQLMRLAYRDPLTGLPNRSYFLEELSKERRRNERQGGMACLLILDLDDFKTINDSLGHMAGDQLLMGVAERLRGCLREEDLLARMGGDEFTLLLPELGKERQRAQIYAERVAERIRATMGDSVPIGSVSVVVSTSIGLTLFPDRDPEGVDIVQKADTALYEAKSRGKGEYAVFQPEMLESTQERLHLEQDLFVALEGDQLDLYYQPIIHLESGTVAGVEALMRWDHPERGCILPGSFIPVAEQTGLIHRLGQWSLNRVLEDWCPGHEGTHPAFPVGISVNISARHFHHPEFEADLDFALDRWRFDPSWLCLDLSEEILFHHPEAAFERLQRLHDKGIRLAIDDFGRGYSSLAFLRDLPIQSLKVERGFIKDLENHPSSKVLTTAILGLAEQLHLTVVAKGVESPGQLRWLQEQGCSYGLGHLLGAPSLTFRAGD